MGVRYLASMLPASLGWPLVILGLCGIVHLIWRRPSLAALLLTFPILYAVVFARASVLFSRYMIPV